MTISDGNLTLGRCAFLFAGFLCAATLGCDRNSVDRTSAAAATKGDAEAILALDAFDPWYQLNKEGRVFQLRLTDRHLTMAALAEVDKLSAVEMLNFARTDLTDEGLAQLKNLPKLSWIGLTNTQITDEGLLQLDKFKSLRELQVRINRNFGTRVTDEGIEKLKAACPKIRVS